jgi:tetratricopeptide (TPR) repeat protein
MDGRALAVAGLLFLIPTEQWAASHSMQEMLVTVVNKHFDPPRAVPNVRVSISYFDGSEKVTDARERTNRQGQTELKVSPDIQMRGDLRIEVSDAEELVVYQPSEGLLAGVPATLTIVLLPKGSPALLEPVQIEAMLNRLSRLSAQNQQLRVSLNNVEHQKLDFDQALRDWATTNGLPYNEVNEKVRAWSDDVLAHREQSSLVKQAEAELGLRHFERAAVLFQGAANSSKLALHQGQEKYLSQRRKELHAMVQEAEQSASAFQLALQFSKATEVMDDACKEAGAEHQHYPNDVELKNIWLNGSLYTEGVRWEEGSWALTSSSSMKSTEELYASVINNLEALVNQIDKANEPLQWAEVKRSLSSHLFHQSFLEYGDLGNGHAYEFQTRAIAAAREALGVCDREKDPRLWADIESTLGLILAAQISQDLANTGRARGQADDLLQQAIDATRASMQFYSKSDYPTDWGLRQTRIGQTLLLQSRLTKGTRAKELLDQAEEADRTALEVLKRVGRPEEWSLGEQNLGTVLLQRGSSTSGDQSETSLSDAATAFRAALQGRDEKENPLEWADTQKALADALWFRGIRKTGNEARELFAQSAAAYRAKLEVVTKSKLPRDWADTQRWLGQALFLQSEKSTGNEPGELLTEAAAAYRAALEVFTKEEFGPQWARTQHALGRVLARQAVLTNGSESDEFLARAIDAHRDALKVLTRENDGPEWVTAESALGDLLVVMARRASGSRADDFFAEAASVYSKVLDGSPRNVRVLSALAAVYHDYMTDFAKAYDLAKRAKDSRPSDITRMNFAEAALTTSSFPECLDSVNSTNEGEMQNTLVPARRILLLACQWGAGQQKAAIETAEKLAEYATAIPKSGWVTLGDRKYLETATEFQLGRALWIKVFRSLENNDGPSLAEAARGLHDAMGR